MITGIPCKKFTMLILCFRAKIIWYVRPVAIYVSLSIQYGILVFKPDEPTAKPERFVLLSKLEKAGDNEATVKFLVLDTGKSGAVISAPKMILHYGKKEQLALKDGKYKIKLEATATVE